jgi:intracellular sulfur oxidation DsrE/DsrF family protein
MHFLPAPLSRRGLLGLLPSSVFGVTLGAVASGSRSTAAANEPWLQGLNGKHRQFFDVGDARNGRPLARVAGFLDTYRDAYGLTDGDTNVIFGAHDSGIALVLGDAVWTRYSLGARYGLLNSKAGGAPHVANVFATERAGGNPKGASVEALTARGVRFLVCQRTLNRLAGDLAAGRGTTDDVRQELVNGLLPGVTVVPAMIVAANRAQEQGLAYTCLG